MKKLLSPWFALVTLALIISVRVIDPSFVESIRLRYFDTLISNKPIVESENVAIVNIDDSTIEKYGQFPWPRDQYAKFIDELYARDAGLVVFNVLMSEKDRLGGDSALEQTMNVMPVILPNVPSGKTKNSPRYPGSVILNPEYQDKIVQYPGIISNIPAFEKIAAGVGSTNTLPEIDGVNRRIPLLSSIENNLYPALSLETLRVLSGDTTFQVKLNELGIEKLRIPGFGPISTDSLGRIWIDWSQKNQIGRAHV